MAVQKPDYMEFIERYLDCPCQYFAPMADDGPLMEAYEAARERGAREGFVPMIVALSDTLADTLSEGTDWSLDLEKVRAKRQALLSVPLQDDPASEIIRERQTKAEEDGFSWDEMGAADETDGEPVTRFLGYWDYGTKKTEPLLLAEIPAENPWEVFAWLPFGGWNECPDTAEQMAMARYWFQRHGAVPAVVTADVLEYILPVPVGQEAAVRLALEQYAFCADIVDQGVGTLEALAAGLAQSDRWYFWWD